MKRRFSIYHFLIALMAFTLVIPGFAGATVNGNDAPKGSLTIHKYEREPGVEEGVDGDGSEGQQIPEDVNKLDGVKFKITQSHTLTFDGNGNEVWAAVQGTPYTDTRTTVDGKVVFDNLPLGRYTVDEIDGPEHVNLNPNSYSVDIPMTSKDGKDLNYNVHIYPKNETIRGAVELTKISGETNEKLPGAKFKLYDSNDEEVNTGKVYETDEHGVIQVDGLAYGDYYFIEIEAPEGHLKQS